MKRFLAVAGTSVALVIGTNSGAMAAPTDADRDGLTRGQEIRITETNPNDRDSNNDGVRDGNEDEDRDGIDNTDEKVVGTGMGDPDSDDDGTSDDDDDREDGDDD